MSLFQFHQVHRLPGLMALTTLFLACEPTPSYSIPERPIVGEILEEESAVVTADNQPIVLQAVVARLSVPAGAYPASTRVTLRLVNGLPMPADTRSSYFGYPQDYPVQAVQVLPAQPSPAQPLQLVLFGGMQSLNYAVFHAREGDSTWTNTGTVLLNTGTGLSVAMSEPGLWTAGSPSSASTGGAHDGGRD